MTIFKRFVGFVQLPAKTAALFPFLLALFYSLYTYRHVDVPSTVLFFISMLAFELSVTGLNSYVDTRHNGMELQFSRPTARRILTGLWVVAMAAALLLVARTGWVVLVCGALCFFIGIVYSFGPAPISHMPLGEAFSGVFEGFFIPFLVTFINSPPDSLVGYSFQDWVLRIDFNLAGLCRLLILVIPAMCGIADIMLANNICDLAADAAVKRYTLPYYIGVRGGLRLFALLDYAAFASVILTAALGILPPYVLVTLAVFPVVQAHICGFRRHQSKVETFPLSVKNFALVMVPLILSAGVAAVFRAWR